MPANKVNLTTLQKQEKTSNGLSTVTSKKKKRSCNKHKRHCRQYLLHSEYRSTYTWHEYTGPQEHTVVRRAPQPPPTSRPTLEPPLPRRKKCPELAYKTHEFITVADGGGMDAVDSNVVAERVGEVTGSSALPPSQLSKAISRISTEYRLQFAWPKRAQLTNGEAVHPAGTGINSTAAGPPRKSLSMGALKQGIAPTGPAPVHKKRLGDVDHKRDGVQASELEPLVGSDHVDGVVLEGDEREEDPSELKVAFRSVTKEEKEKENTRKVAPTATMPPAGRPSSVQARPIHGIPQDELKADNEKAIARARKDFLIRHHLDRTTGIGDGALLPSPTREKLEPVIPRKREDTKERDEIQPRSKSSPKNSPRTGRSQSLGPSRSPKRQTIRAPSVTKEIKEKEGKEKEHKEEPERHPRPMTGEPQVNGDTTTGDTTSSIASTPPSQTTAPAVAQSPWIDDEPVVKSPPEPTRVKSPEQMIIRSPEPVNWTVPLDTGKTFTVTQNVREEPLTRPHSEAKSWAPSSVPSAPQSAPQSAPPELAAQHKSHHSQHSGYKSPESESVSLGSFTGLNGHKDLDSERDSPLPSNVIQPNLTHADKGSVDADDEQRGTEPSVKPVAGTNLRCLEDPDFEYERKRGDVPLTAATSSIPQEQQPQQQQQQQQQQQGSGYRILEAEPLQATSTTAPGAAQRSVASDVLEKARNRFDKFWGKGPEN